MASSSQQQLKQPKSIKFEYTVTDISCHPSRHMIASGDIDGVVRLHSYSVVNENHLLMTFNNHKKACRVIRFAQGGTELVTVSKDKSLQVIDLDDGAVKMTIKKAHDCPIYSLCIVNRNIVTTGDDDGFLKVTTLKTWAERKEDIVDNSVVHVLADLSSHLTPRMIPYEVWDLRHRKAVMTVDVTEDCVTGMIVNSAKWLLLATSGDGTLTAFDIRKHKKKMQSESLGAGLMSILAIKNETKVVCGTEDGSLNFFNWNEWGNISDRFPGHKMSVDAIVPLSDNVVATADSKAIRAVHLFPNRFIGVIGSHKCFPIERLTLSHCKQYLASCSHDKKIKFWNVTEVAKVEVDGHEKADRKKFSMPCGGSSNNDFYKGLAESDDEVAVVPSASAKTAESDTYDSEEEAFLAESTSESDDDDDDDEDISDNDNNANNIVVRDHHNYDRDDYDDDDDADDDDD